MVVREIVRLQTRGRSFELLTERVANIVAGSGIREGLCNLFIRHTSASLIVSENADPAVQRDLERFMQRLTPDGSPDYEHDAEGPDDMPAHIKSALTQTSLGIPVSGGRPVLGTWQGLYLFEHRTRPHRRQVVLHLIGE